MSVLKKYSYLWLTGAFFVVSITIQWLTHEGTTAEFVNAVAENWQSEFLQLLWQVGGLMIFYAWGSSQSRDETEKQDRLIRDTHRIVRELQNEIRGKQFMAQEADQFQRLGQPPLRNP